VPAIPVTYISMFARLSQEIHRADTRTTGTANTVSGASKRATPAGPGSARK